MPNVKERKAPRARVVKRPKVDREVLKQLLTAHVAPQVVEWANRYGWNGSTYSEETRRYEQNKITEKDVSIHSFKVKKTDPQYKYDIYVVYGYHGRTIRLRITHKGRIIR